MSSSSFTDCHSAISPLSPLSPLELLNDIKLYVTTHKHYKHLPNVEIVKSLFKERLHLAPYYMKYNLDERYPSLVLIYATDKSNLLLSSVRKANGAIFDVLSFDLVVAPCKDFISLTPQEMTLLIQGSDPNQSVPVSTTYDGTLLRVTKLPTGTVQEAELKQGQVEQVEDKENEQNDKKDLRNPQTSNRWLVSTNKRVSADRAFWGDNESFQERFQQRLMGPISEFCEQSGFQEGMTYCFTLTKSPNGSDAIGLVAQYSTKDTSCKRKAIELPLGKLASHLTALNEGPELHRGILFDLNGHQYLVDTPRFTTLARIRNNQPSLDLSYISHDAVGRYEMRKQYPEKGLEFDSLDSKLAKLPFELYLLYKERYIYKYYVPDDHPFQPALKRLQHQYLSMGRHPITLEDVKEVLADQSRVKTRQIKDMLSIFK